MFIMSITACKPSLSLAQSPFRIRLLGLSTAHPSPAVPIAPWSIKTTRSKQKTT